MNLFSDLIPLLIAIIFWGSYLVPMKKVKEYDPYFFQFLFCSAVLISSIVFSFFFAEFVLSPFAILSGFLFAVGNVFSLAAVKESGMSRAFPIWVGVGISVVFLFGVFFLSESFASLLFAIIALVLVIAGVFLVSSTNDQKKESSTKGILFAVCAGILFGSYLVPFKLANMELLSFLFPMSIGIFVGSLVIFLYKRPQIDATILVSGSFSGFLWNIGNVANFSVVSNFGLALGSSLTQICLFIGFLWGLFYFKEVKDSGKIISIIFGSILLFAGAILLAFSK